MRRLIAICLTTASCICAVAADFDSLFSNQTVRYDLKISTWGARQVLALENPKTWDGWWGRRVNLDRPMYSSELSYVLIDDASGDTIYSDAKYLAPIDQECQYSTLILPRPLKPAHLTVSIWGHDDETGSPLRSISTALPDSIEKANRQCAYHMLRQAADTSRVVTIAIIGDGYTQDQMDKFMADAVRLDSALFSHKAYGDCADCFNIAAVMLESSESGISRPSKGIVVNSALGAHFDSFALDRLITIPDVRPLWDALVGVPAQQIMILCNTPEYGGSGPYNEYAIASSDNPWSMYTMVHEFGHTFPNLGDEYEDGYEIFYSADFEPVEPNITTLKDFGSKWADMVEEGTAALYEGAGYQAKGVYRGCEKCLMRSLQDLHLCPVCDRAIARTIDFYTRQAE